MKRKALISLLGLTLLFNNSNISILASDIDEITSSGNTTSSMDISLELADEFTVRIPKSISLSDSETVFNIGVKGKILENRDVVIECDELVELVGQNTGKTSQIYIDLDDKDWQHTEVKEDEYVEHECSIIHNETQPDKYSGKADFNITVGEHKHNFVGLKCAGKNCNETLVEAGVQGVFNSNTGDNVSTLSEIVGNGTTTSSIVLNEMTEKLSQLSTDKSIEQLGVYLDTTELSLNDTVFYESQVLDTVSISADTLTLGTDIFNKCSNVGFIELQYKNSLRLENNLFKGCENLKTLVINGDIESIDATAFIGCNSLTDIYYTGNWDEVEKASGWDEYLPFYVEIHDNWNGSNLE